MHSNQICCYLKPHRPHVGYQKGLNQLATKPNIATCSLSPGWKGERIKSVKVRSLMGDLLEKAIHASKEKQEFFFPICHEQAGLSHAQDSLASLGVAILGRKSLSLQMLPLPPSSPSSIKAWTLC